MSESIAIGVGEERGREIEKIGPEGTIEYLLVCAQRHDLSTHRLFLIGLAEQFLDAVEGDQKNKKREEIAKVLGSDTSEKLETREGVFDELLVCARIVEDSFVALFLLGRASDILSTLPSGEETEKRKAAYRTTLDSSLKK